MEENHGEDLSINGRPFQVLKLLGKGKGGYSWQVTDGRDVFVLKQIHHEPCSYYQFGKCAGSSMERA